MPLNFPYHVTLILILTLPSPISSKVTIFPSNTAPRAYTPIGPPPALNPQSLFHHSCPDEHTRHPNATVHVSPPFLFGSNSTQDGTQDTLLYPSSSSLIHGILDAWAQHQHLALRPDEVWFAILTQLNFYMTANAESLRHLFVSSMNGSAGQGQAKETISVGDVSWEGILHAFGAALQARLKAAWLLDWITPTFSTSTPDDKITANVLMMGLMRAYFDYEGYMICGLPSVTLLGTQDDWQSLFDKLDRLAEFGHEPQAYAQQIRPILTRFVASFEDPDADEIRAFWNGIVSAEKTDGWCGMPPYYVSGWLLGFLFWDRDGRPLKPSWEDAITLDGITYSPRAITELPVGYAQVPFTMRRYEGMDRFPAYIVAGNIAKSVRKGAPEGYVEALRRFNGSEADVTVPQGVLEPKSGWLLYGPANHGDVPLREPPDQGEVWNLAQALDASYTEQCLGSQPVQLGVAGEESVAYQAFHKERQEAMRLAEDDLDEDEEY